MKERPILFSAPMVRAILDGRKTQTRRVVKIPSTPKLYSESDWMIDCVPIGKCPYGQLGDRLWVREAFMYLDNRDGGRKVHYCAGGDDMQITAGKDDDWRGSTKWKPSIHMRREYSRITLEVVDVRVERLQEISYEDAIAEGVSDMTALLHDEWQPSNGESGDDCARRLRWPQPLYQQLWDSIHGPSAWDTNPWVWVVEFRRITC